MDVGFEAQVTAVCVDSVDHTDADTRIQLIYQLTDDLGTGFQEGLQSGAVVEEARPQQVVGGEGDVEVRDFEEVASDVLTQLSTRTLPQEGQKRVLQEKGTQRSYWQPGQT